MTRGTRSLSLAAICGFLCAGSNDPVADLKSAVAAYDAHRYPAAIAALEGLPKRLPKIADYIAWYIASSQFESQNYAAVPKSLEPIWKNTPPSPLAAKAVLLATKAYGANGDTKQAVEILRANYATLPQPAGDLAMANAFEAAGDSVSAAIYFQRVYYGYPTSGESGPAETEMARLRAKLGDAYPPPMPTAMLGRAFKLLDGGVHKRARRELETLIPQLGGAERDLARVRVGVADYEAKETLAAQRYLRALEISSPEPDAERLCYLAYCSRRLKNQDEVHATLDKLARLYPQSKWRLQALVADANSHLIENELDTYEPLYRSCYESFPSDPQAAICHWKVVWGHYLRRRPDAAEMMRAHLRMFPASEDSAGALYFLGRLAESSSDPASARAYYDEIVREYPNYYYTVLARERLKEIPAKPSTSVNEFLRTVAFPKRSRTLNFEPNATAKLRIERAQLLLAAGLDDLAEGELRFAAQNEDQPHVISIELAALASKRTGPDQAMRLIKRYASGYLYYPLESAPTEFWKLAFPLPYRAELEKFAKQNGLDPFLVAALIRQESEFNPKAVSVANARGLTQIEPATGRELSRKLKIVPYSTPRLFQPSVNLQLGTFYLKTMLERLNGHAEAALAAYNAGLSRAHAWLSWGEFREPAEFVETVPFTQTRGYIQTVLRNADVYRRLYGSQAPASTRAANR
jgi:soluble lytic murein transglycosylase